MAHTSKCSDSTAPLSSCQCSCKGAQHGSAGSRAVRNAAVWASTRAWSVRNGVIDKNDEFTLAENRGALRASELAYDNERNPDYLSRLSPEIRAGAEAEMTTWANKIAWCAAHYPGQNADQIVHHVFIDDKELDDWLAQTNAADRALKDDIARTRTAESKAAEANRADDRANELDAHLTTTQQNAIAAAGPLRRSHSECWMPDEYGSRRHVLSEDTYIDMYGYEGVYWVNTVDGGTNTWDRYGSRYTANIAYQTAVNNFGPAGSLDEDGKPVWTTTDVEGIPDTEIPAAHAGSWTEGMRR